MKFAIRESAAPESSSRGRWVTCMRTKSFDEISVQDITEAATVNRATFYDHYTDKFALMEAMVAGGFHELLHERQLRYDTGCPAALGAIIQATCDFLTQAHSGGACDRQTAFRTFDGRGHREGDPALAHGGIATGAAARLPSSPELIAAPPVAAIFGGVKQWLSMPERPPVESARGPVAGADSAHAGSRL